VLLRVVGRVVHAHHDGDVLASGRGRDDNLLCPRLEMGPGFRGIREKPRALDDDPDPFVIPGDLRGVAVGEALDRPAVDDQLILSSGHGSRKASVVGVVLEEVRVGLHVEEVVDGNNLQGARIALEDRLQHLAPDPSEPVDPDPYHFLLPPVAEIRFLEAPCRAPSALRLPFSCHRSGTCVRSPGRNSSSGHCTGGRCPGRWRSGWPRPRETGFPACRTSALPPCRPGAPR